MNTGYMTANTYDKYSWCHRDESWWWLFPTGLVLCKCIQARLIDWHVANLEIQDRSLYSKDPNVFWQSWYIVHRQHTNTGRCKLLFFLAEGLQRVARVNCLCLPFILWGTWVFHFLPAEERGFPYSKIPFFFFFPGDLFILYCIEWISVLDHVQSHFFLFFFFLLS